MLYNKNALSTVVAVALLLVVSVISVVGFSNWYSNFSSLIFSSVEFDNQISDSQVKIIDLIGNILYFDAGNNLNITSILIGGVDCKISGNFSGLSEFDVRYCLELVSLDVSEVLIISNAGAFSKTVSVGLVDEVLPPDYFISVWDTTLGGISGNNEINLPLTGGGDFDFYVTGNTLIGSPVHIMSDLDDVLTFEYPGVHQIYIDGTINGFRFVNGGDKLKLLDIKQWGILQVGNSGRYFQGCKNLKGTFKDNLDTSAMTDFSSMFFDCYNFVGDISSWNVSNITDMTTMFQDAYVFNSNIGSWDVSSVNWMNGMFQRAKLFNQDLNGWDVSSVETMNAMFYLASDFNGDVSSWNTSSVQIMSNLFCYALDFNKSISNWNTSNVVNMRGMFRNARSFNQNISYWDLHNVTNIGRMFQAADYFNQNLTSWNLSNVVTCDDFDSSTGDWDSFFRVNFSSQGSSCEP